MQYPQSSCLGNRIRSMVGTESMDKLKLVWVTEAPIPESVLSLECDYEH